MKTLDFEQLNSMDSHSRSVFIKELEDVAENDPASLYPLLDQFVALLESKNNQLKWSAIDIIGLLSQVDKYNKTTAYIPLLIGFIHEGHMVTTNHAIFALSLIGENKPEQRAQIIRELLNVREYAFDTEECKNIVIGKVLQAMKILLEYHKPTKEMIDFIREAQQNKRELTKEKADSLMNILLKRAMKRNRHKQKLKYTLAHADTILRNEH